MSIFVFLEIHDAPVVEVLSELRSIFKGRESKTPIHITVRGPYKTQPHEEQLEKLLEKIENEGLLLHGVGRFDFENKSYVFLKANSKVVREIWWKKDYPIDKFGFNPHITLYEGPQNIAIQVEKFLKNERIECFCRDLSLSIYQSGQMDLYGNNIEPVQIQSKIFEQGLIRPYRWNPGIESRARELMSQLKLELKG